MKTPTRLLTALPILLAAVLVSLLPGCGKPSGEASGQPEALRLFVWSEYVPQEVIDLFTAETGIKVSVENYASNEEMLAKLFAGGGSYDIIQPSEYTIQALIKQNLLLPLNHENIPNLKNIAPEFRNMPFDPGNKFSVPWMAGFVGIVYNSEVIPGPIAGFVDVFREDHRNRIVILDDAREITSWALATQGIPINDLSEENLEKVRPLVASWLPLVKVFDSDSPKTSLLNGDTDIGVVWSGEAALLHQQNPKFKWVLPAEGAHLFVDNLAIPKTARNQATAEKFINFILRPDVSKMISDHFPYYNPNAEARKLLSPEQLANPASYPPGTELGKMQIFTDIGERASAVDEFITGLKVQR